MCRLATLTLAVLCASPVWAKPEACLTSITGTQQTLGFDPDEPNVRANTSLKERTFGGPDGIECPGFVTLNAILQKIDPDITYAQMEPFCLQYDPVAQTYLGVAVGRRDARLICKTPSKSLCQRVNATKDAALAAANFGVGILKGTEPTAVNAGIRAVAGGSGAIVLSGPASYLSEALATFGASALSTLTAPATVTAAAVTVVVAGGAIYACSE
jgi:hypothetical protein